MTLSAPDGEPTLGRAAWWRFAVAIIAVAIAGAAFAIVFRGTVDLFTRALCGSKSVVDLMTRAPWWERVAMPAVGGLLVGLLGLIAARYRGAGGLGRVMEAIVLGRLRIGLRRSVLQAGASWIAIATGNSLGREGALIQMGAAFGEAARRALRLDDARGRVAIAAGAAAGFTAAYNTPIAAVLFVVEVVTGVIVLDTVVPVLFATLIATVLTRAVNGEMPIYGTRTFRLTSPGELLAYVGLGIVAGLVGVGFLRLLAGAERAWDRIPPPWRPAAGGAVCGAILIAIPAVAGNGYEPLNGLLNLDARSAVPLLALWLLIAKPAATVASVGSGNPGGVFTPTLLIGGCVGTLYGIGLHAIGGTAIGPAGDYALVGVAAALSATTFAPLTAAVMVFELSGFELSGDYSIVLPLIAATAIAGGLARRLQRDSVYGAELRRRGVAWSLTFDGHRVVESLEHKDDSG